MDTFRAMNYEVHLTGSFSPLLRANTRSNIPADSANTHNTSQQIEYKGNVWARECLIVNKQTWYDRTRLLWAVGTVKMCPTGSNISIKLLPLIFYNSSTSCLRTGSLYLINIFSNLHFTTSRYSKHYCWETNYLDTYIHLN